MNSASIKDSENGKAIEIPKVEIKYESKLIDKDFQKSEDKSKMSETSIGLKDNENMKAISITTNVDEIISVTESVLDAALENFNEWYDDICQNGIPIKDDIFETIKNETIKIETIKIETIKNETIKNETIKNDAKIQSISTQSSKHENIQKEVKSQKEQCRIQYGFKRSRCFLVLFLLFTIFSVMSDVKTEHSLQIFPTNPLFQVRPTSNMFELKAPQKTGILSIMKDLFPLRDNLGIGSCFVGVEC